MIRLAHISTDEKFIDLAISIYKDLEGVESTFFVMVNKELHYIKNKDVICIPNQADLIKEINHRQDIDFVVLHSMLLSSRFLLRLRRPIIWSTWGADIYSDKSDSFQKLITLDLYKPKTRAFLTTDSTQYDKGIKAFFKRFKRKMAQKLALRKIRYVSAPLPFEFDLIKKQLPHVQNYPFRYMYKKGHLPSTASRNESSNKRILVGNSCNKTNNHVDIFDSLNKLNCKLDIIVPFSYSDRPAYNEFVKNRAKDFKNLNITFLETFMPLEEYEKILATCNAAIFGHIRQQAVGNITSMFAMGKKVFLYKDSLLYKHFRQQKNKFFSIEDDLTAENLNTALSEADQHYNSKLIAQRCDYSQYIAQLQDFFNKLS